MINFYCSAPEYQLIEDIQFVGYGEIYDVLFKAGPPHGMVKLEPSSIALLHCLRAGDRFDKVLIHDSLPTIGERTGVTAAGRRYTQKIKF